MTAKSGSCVGSKLIFACSGGSDVGHLTDLAAREMTKRGAGKMYCLAGIGGRVEPILATARSAESILAIDGCAQNCAKNTLEQAGFSDFVHVQLAELGFSKGQSEPTAGRISMVAEKVIEKLK